MRLQLALTVPPGMSAIVMTEQMQVHHLNVEAPLFYPSKKASVDRSVIQIRNLHGIEIKQNGGHFLQDRLTNFLI